MSVNIRRAVARWHLDDMSIVQAAGRPIDSDYVFILLVKAQQLSDMKAFEESMDLLIAVERVFNDKPWSIEKQKATDYLKFQKVMLKMTEYQECKGHNITETEDLDELTKDVKECFEKLTSLSKFMNSFPIFLWGNRMYVYFNFFFSKCRRQFVFKGCF